MVRGVTLDALADHDVELNSYQSQVGIKQNLVSTKNCLQCCLLFFRSKIMLSDSNKTAAAFFCVKVQLATVVLSQLNGYQLVT